MTVIAMLGAHYTTAVGAQTRYDPTVLGFDLWCQVQANLPPRRCDRRTTADQKAYDDYRNKIDGFGIPYLQGKNHQDRMEQNLMNTDPVDNPHP